MTEALAEKWRQEAAMMRRRGQSDTAELLESCALELEADAREWELAALSLEEATKESGYSYSALQKKVASGELENVGRKGSPRLRRCDLPRKGAATPSRGIADKVLERRSA